MNAQFMSASRRVLEWLFRTACAACFAASGVMLGFCFARWVGPLILRGEGGVEMADLGYMFMGAVLGGLAGFALGVKNALGLPSRPLLRQSGFAVVLGALAVLVTALLNRS